MQWRAAVVLSLVTALLLVAACSSSDTSEPMPAATQTSPATVSSPSTTSPRPAPSIPPSHSVVTDGPIRYSSQEYRPGLDAHLFLPEEEGHVPLVADVPLVVMVPGGAWRSADPTGLAGLARSLARSGIAALTVEVSSAEDDATYPAPIEDIHCAVGHGRSRLAQAGLSRGPVVLLGHSSGAHLAALAASTPRELLPECDHPPAVADALVGLAGVYDVSRLPALAYLLFGVTPEEDPDTWEEGNPLHRAHLRPGVPALLLHGADDPLVPVSFTRDFAAVLEEGGHDTTVTVIPGADHADIYSADTSGELISRWITRLTSGN